MTQDNHDNILFKGEPVQLPLDLFIPPDALEVWLDEFEGPLDLLLHLIRKNHFDILDIPISDIAKQYMDYIHYLEAERFELASEYLVMAAWLAEIKSRILLPRPELDDEGEEEDPRLELMRRLQIYAQYKEVAKELSELKMMERDTFKTQPELPKIDVTPPPPEVSVEMLVSALKKLLAKAALTQKHTIQREQISIEERMHDILSLISSANNEAPIPFEKLFNPKEGRYGITISFLSVLELARNQQITLFQNTAYAPIFITSATSKR